MTRRELKRLARHQLVDARVLSDGCRDYLVEVVSRAGAGILHERSGSLKRFRNLADVHRVLDSCGVANVVLRQRTAHDEATTVGEVDAPFHDLPLKTAS